MSDEVNNQPRGNRRQYPRIDTGGVLRAQLFMEAEVVMLSARGMMIRLAFSPNVGARHSFTLSFGTHSMSVFGVVRNSEAHPQGDQPAYHVGIEFVDLDRHQEAFLEKFVEQKLHS